MIDEPRARELAVAAFEAEGDAAALGLVRELDHGWYFPVVAKRYEFFNGVIVNKHTGRVLRVMMHASLDRDPSLYDRGFQFDTYDVVVLAIANLHETVRTLLELKERTVDTYYRYGRVYRVGRALTEPEIRDRLCTLPAVFWGRPTFTLERFDAAREAGWFEFEMLEYRGKK